MVAIFIVAFCSGSLASIAIYLGDPLTGKFCALVLAAVVLQDTVSVHLSQTGFAAHLVENNNVHDRNITPDATPYRLGLPIDACPESDEADNCPALIERKKKYQSVVGSIGWLAISGGRHRTHLLLRLIVVVGPPITSGSI